MVLEILLRGISVRYKLYCASFIFMMLFVLSTPVASTIAGQQESVQSSPAVSSFQGPPQPTSSLDEDFLTWTSRWQSQPLSVVNDTELVGDHVVLNATFPDYLNVTKSEIELGNGFRINTTRELVIPSDPGGQFSGTINHTEFDWVIVNGLERGLKVNIVCNFTNADCDFMVWSGAQEYSLFAYDNNLADMVSGRKPETDVFTWEFDDDTMYVGCLNYDSTPGNWTLLLQVGVYDVVESDTNSVVYDTYTLDNSNQTVDVRVVGYTASNETLVYNFRNITISNFFNPEVTLNPPIHLGNATFNFTWVSTDKNADDVNCFSVWLSFDDGVYFQILARNLTQSFYIWDSSGFLESAHYVFRIRAYSVDLVAGLGKVDYHENYWPGDFSDALSTSFCAGTDSSGGGHYYVSSIEPPDDFTIFLGESPGTISWILDTTDGPVLGFMVNFEIYHNGTLLENDTYYTATPWYGEISDRTIVFNLDSLSLSIGSHNFTIVVTTPESSYCYNHFDSVVVKDTVFVFVVEPDMPPENDNLLFIGLASIAVVVVLIYILRIEGIRAK